MVWLHLAKVSQLELQHHLNVEEWYLPTASCISPVWAPDRFQIKCHCSQAGKALKQLFHSMEVIRIKTNNETDDIFDQKIEVSISPCFVRVFSLAAGDWTFPGVFDPLTLYLQSVPRVTIRCNYHRKKQLCLGIKNVSANNKTVKSVLPMFYPISGVVVPFPAPQSSVVMVVVVLKVLGVWSLPPGRLWCSWWCFCLSLRPIWVHLYDC